VILRTSFGTPPRGGVGVEEGWSPLETRVRLWSLSSRIGADCVLVLVFSCLGEAHVDSDYEAIHSKFQNYNATLLKLRSNSSNYVAATYSLFQNSNNVSVDFSQLLEEAAVKNDYQEVAQQSRAAHNRLNSEKQASVAGLLADKVIAPIDEELKVHQSLLTRIARRNELHSELEYYLNKIHGLNKDREARAAKGKSDSSSDLEKFNRNNDKLSTARNDYTNFASALMADLTNNWNSRITILGPALASFIQAEKTFLQLYATELNEINKSAALPQLSQSAPADAIPPSVTSSDIPKPVVHGDLQVTHQEGVVASLPAEAWSERQAAVASQYPVAAETPLHASAPSNNNPFDDQPSEQTIPGGVAHAEPMPSPKLGESYASEQAQPIVVDPTATMVHNQNLAASAIIMSPAKSQNEAEHKSQRFENDQKQAALF
jgi:hypothetical protein